MNSGTVELLARLKQLSRTKFVHRTWAGTFFCTPQVYFQPESIEDVQEVVRAAKFSGKTIMVVGSGHSPSDLTMTKEWLVNLDRLDSVYKQSPGELYGDFTVGGGMRVYQLNEYLASKHYALQNLGSISDQSVAGLISTGTHGSSAFHGLVSQQVVDITFVNGKGDLQYASQEKNTEVFRAVLLGLGKIGIIVKVTVRAVPAFRIKSIQQVILFDKLISYWENIWISSEFIRVWWYPYTGKCVVWRASKSDEAATTDDVATNFGQTFGRVFYEALLWVSVNVYPKLTPWVERFIFNKQFGNLEEFRIEGGYPNRHNDYHIQVSNDGLNMDCLFSQLVNEWAAPLVNGPEILGLLNHSLEEAAAKGDFYIHVPVEIRCSNNTFISGDPQQLHKNLESRKAIDIGSVNGNNVKPYLDPSPQLATIDSVSYLTSTSLSSSTSTLKAKPSFLKLNTVIDQPITNITNSQLTLYINMTMYMPFGTTPPVGKVYRIFEDILTAADGKPHWAKNFIGSTSYLPANYPENEHYSDGEMIGFAKKNQEWFGDDLAEFQKIRRSEDPDGVFLSGKDWAIRNGIIVPNE